MSNDSDSPEPLKSQEDSLKVSEAAEKKGLFGRLFSRKKAPESEQAPKEAVPQSVQSSVPEESAPVETAEALVIAEAPVVKETLQSETIVQQESSPEQLDQKEPVHDLPEEKQKGFFVRLKQGLSRTSNNLAEGVGSLVLGKKEIDAELLEDIETQLIMADIGMEATASIIDKLTRRVSRKELQKPEALYQALQDELHKLLLPGDKPLDVSGAQSPYVILMVGVNGVGKTTTIGKLAKRFLGEGRSVMLAAGDTFRAAAVEQLQVWGERNNVPVVAQHTGADSASVVFDALQAAKARNIDVLIADTAGRFQNKDNLMEELKKIVRVMGKLDDSAPHEVMLVLDAGTGQNALVQAEQFGQAVGVTGLTLTKLDGTAKGGIIFAIVNKLGLPVRFIGVGESAEDLRTFNAREFIDALFNKSVSNSTDGRVVTSGDVD